jgi:hypothetical protein
MQMPATACSSCRWDRSLDLVLLVELGGGIGDIKGNAGLRRDVWMKYLGDGDTSDGISEASAT